MRDPGRAGYSRSPELAARLGDTGAGSRSRCTGRRDRSSAIERGQGEPRRGDGACAISIRGDDPRPLRGHRTPPHGATAQTPCRPADSIASGEGMGPVRPSLDRRATPADAPVARAADLSQVVPAVRTERRSPRTGGRGTWTEQHRRMLPRRGCQRGRHRGHRRRAFLAPHHLRRTPSAIRPLPRCQPPRTRRGRDRTRLRGCRARCREWKLGDRAGYRMAPPRARRRETRDVDAGRDRARHRELGPPRVLEIDTDGLDAPILLGARDLLAEWRPAVFFEYDPSFYEGRAQVLSDLAAELSAVGYSTLFAFGNLGRLLRTADPAERPMWVRYTQTHWSCRRGRAISICASSTSRTHRRHRPS